MTKAQPAPLLDEIDDDEEDSPVPATPSEIAQEISKLREAAFKVTKDRQRIPQPMFWSVFNLRINELRKKKRLQRFLQETFDGE